MKVDVCVENKKMKSRMKAYNLIFLLYYEAITLTEKTNLLFEVISRTKISLTTINKTSLQFDCMDRSKTNSKRGPIVFSFALNEPLKIVVSKQGDL